MKILFIYPDIGTKVMNFSPAIQVLSAVLKRDRFETSIIHVNENATPYDLKLIVNLARGYDLYALTSTTFNYKYANEIAGRLQSAYPEKLVILGGSHATIQPEDFESSNFDMFCIGEGELPMLELCQALRDGKSWSAIPNFINRFRKNPVRGYLKDLNWLPRWDFDIIDTKKILKQRGGWLSISFSRGCPYECTFCINHLYKQIELGEGDKLSDYIRRREPSEVVAELESLLLKFDIKFFNIDDDLLTLYKSWMQEFTQLYREKIFLPTGIKYVINARADSLTEDICSILASSGCKEARIGFETGNEKLRNELLDKRTSNKDLKTAFSNLDKYDIQSVAFGMIGLPGESWQTFHDTISAIIEYRPRLMRWTFLYPYKHTKIYNYCVEHSLFKTDYVPDNRDYSSPLLFENITDKELFTMRFLMPWFINSRMLNEIAMQVVYNDLIVEYSDKSLDELLSLIPEIISIDAYYSSLCKEPHYRYYSANIDYFELVL